MALRLYESHDCWRLSVEGLSTFPGGGLLKYLSERKHSELVFHKPFESSIIGEGGEAIVALHNGIAFRFEHMLMAEGVSDQTRASYLERFRNFPQKLPEQIVLPHKPIYLRLGERDVVIGHTQRHIKNAIALETFLSPKWRTERGVMNRCVTQVLLSLFDGLHALHAARCVRGEINPSNFGVVGEKVYFWDMLGMGFHGFPCTTVYPRYAPPWLLSQDLSLMWDEPKARELLGPYSETSDHYGLSVLVFNAFTGTSPYSGTHKDACTRYDLRSERVRAIMRLPVTHPDVKPNWTYPPEVMSEPLLNYLHDVFQHGKRRPFMRAYLAELQWESCPHCKLEYSGYFCPCYKSKRNFRTRAASSLISGRLAAVFTQKFASR